MSLGYSRPDDLPDTLSTIMQDIIDDIQSGVALFTVTDALPIDGRMGERKTRG